MSLDKLLQGKPKAPAKKQARNLTERGQLMARKKGRKSRRRRMSGEVAYYGGRRKSRRRRMSGEVAYYGGRRRSRRMSGASRGGKINIAQPLMNTALAVGGGIAGRLAKNAIPLPDERMKAAIPVLLGIVLSMMGKRNKMLENVGFGMAAIGGVELLAVLMPNVALFQGEGVPAQVAYTSQDVKEALDQGLISQDEANVLLQAAGYMGMIEDFSGEGEDYQPVVEDSEISDLPWETSENVM